MQENISRDPAEGYDSESQRGASMIEYALLVALIALIALAAIRYLGTAVSTQFSAIGSAVG